MECLPIPPMTIGIAPSVPVAPFAPSTTVTTSGYLLQLDPQGNLDWLLLFDDDNQTAVSDLTVLPDEDIAVAGTFCAWQPDFDEMVHHV